MQIESAAAGVCVCCVLCVSVIVKFVGILSSTADNSYIPVPEKRCESDPRIQWNGILNNQ
jgi:hypothetical protein